MYIFVMVLARVFVVGHSLQISFGENEFIAIEAMQVASSREVLLHLRSERGGTVSIRRAAASRGKRFGCVRSGVDCHVSIRQSVGFTTLSDVDGVAASFVDAVTHALPPRHARVFALRAHSAGGASNLCIHRGYRSQLRYSRDGATRRNLGRNRTITVGALGGKSLDGRHRALASLAATRDTLDCDGGCDEGECFPADFLGVRDESLVTNLDILRVLNRRLEHAMRRAEKTILLMHVVVRAIAKLLDGFHVIF